MPDHGPTGAGVRIAVLDTGVDLQHPDLANAIDLKHSENFTLLSADLVDRWYHGTHIAGIIAGNGTASRGACRGLAPSAELVVMKVATNNGGFEADVVAAIDAALRANVDIINYSASRSPLARCGPAPWVWPSARSAIEEAFDDAAARGVLCIVAGGNDGPSPGSINRPGGLTSVLTVGAMGITGAVTNESSRGPYRVLTTLPPGGVRRWDSLLDTHVEERAKPDVVAPGQDVVAARASQGTAVDERTLADPGDPSCAYVRVSGTSPATAVVSGLAACLLDVARANKVPLGGNQGAALKALLVHGARRLSAGTRYDFGAGLIKWPILEQTLKDFATDARFREIVINGPQLRLLADQEFGGGVR